MRNRRATGVDVRLEIEIAAPPSTVFTFLTEVTRLKTWLADVVEADGRAGGILRIGLPRGGAIEGHYLEVIKDRKVVFTWGGIRGIKPGASTVEFHLEPSAQGTLLRLHHHGLPSDMIERTDRGWASFGLTKLKDAAEGRPPTTRCVEEIAAQRRDLGASIER
jgi:uncharacterized protein YndB with AHSA1/START domain